MIRYHHDAYDRALGDLQPAERRLTEGTFTGLRFVRNCMGHYVDPADFIQPQQDSAGRDAPVAAWTWRHVPAPATSVLRQRSTWENSRYLHYRAHLAERPVGETVNRTAGFLIQLGGRLPALTDHIPCPEDSETLVRADLEELLCPLRRQRGLPGDVQRAVQHRAAKVRGLAVAPQPHVPGRAPPWSGASAMTGARRRDGERGRHDRPLTTIKPSKGVDGSPLGSRPGQPRYPWPGETDSYE